jgi:predicted nucleic acid-binding protein
VITAVDSSILLDVLTGDRTHGEASRSALRASRMGGVVVACEVVWAETAGWFAGDAGRSAVAQLSIEFDPMRLEAAAAAGQAWRAYRASGGPRQRLIADFLIGAHAMVQADRLLTRDRGFYRTYFPSLEVVDPAAARG